MAVPQQILTSFERASHENPLDSGVFIVRVALFAMRVGIMRSREPLKNREHVVYNPRRNVTELQMTADNPTRHEKESNKYG